MTENEKQAFATLAQELFAMNRKLNAIETAIQHSKDSVPSHIKQVYTDCMKNEETAKDILKKLEAFYKLLN